jgi:hypothetical protein
LSWICDDGPLTDPEGNHCWPIEVLLDNGLLWAINTYIAHPRGYAIIAHYDDDECRQFVGFSVHANDGMPVVYPVTREIWLKGRLLAEMLPSPQIPEE